MNSFNNDMAWEREKSLSINMPGLMKDIYLWVAIALAITGFTAYTVAGSPMLLSLVFAGKFTMWALLIATVALVWHLSSAVAHMSLKKAAAMYIIYAVLNGAMMASIFLVYHHDLYRERLLHHRRHLRCHVCLWLPHED